MSDLFEFEQHPDEYAVMGNPIAHSKSPQIHSLFADQTKQNIRYRAIQVDPGGFEQAVGNFFASGGKGLNVTVPFKQEAWSVATNLSERAKLAGAINTLKPDVSDTLFGDNTDGVGLVNDLVINLETIIAGKKVLLIGAGGAARGVLSPLLDEQPGQIVIVNRTVKRAQELAELFSSQRNKNEIILGVGFNEIQDESFDSDFDIVINATSASLKGELPPLPQSSVASTELVYDMMYGAEPTPFLRWAKDSGARKMSDGLGMLVEQAAESFFIWRGVKPESKPVIQSIRESLSS